MRSFDLPGKLLTTNSYEVLQCHNTQKKLEINSNNLGVLETEETTWKSQETSNC